MTPGPAAEPGAGPRERLTRALEHAAHLLPVQSPIRVFVHHNTLHAFEDLPFEEAVVRAAEVFGAEPFLSEEAFGRHLATGRIRGEDLDAVLAEEDLGAEAPIFRGGPSRRELRRLRLGLALEVPEGSALDWALSDGAALLGPHPTVPPSARLALRLHAPPGVTGDAADALVLGALFRGLAAAAPPARPAVAARRPRDLLLRATGFDTDDWVNPLLVRVAASFVDQGIGYWALPGRERGLFHAFRDLYSLPLPPPDRWLAGLRGRLLRSREQGLDAEGTILGLLPELGVADDHLEPFLAATLLSLRGWGGMIEQLAERPDRAPVVAPPARLVDFLAVRLLLDACAASALVAERFGEGVGVADVARMLPEERRAPDLAPVYEAFVLAQHLALDPARLAPGSGAAALVDEVRRFDAKERRRLWQLAFERRHRVTVLDALAAHAPPPEQPGGAAPELAVISCIDDREESFRRHLEETHPSVETYGAAGFFGVAMAFLGLEDVRPRPLCPVVVRPRHLVIEEPVEKDRAARVATRARVVGRLSHATHVGGQTLVRGSLVSSLLGTLAAIPLVGRTLFPRLSEALSRRVQGALVGRPETRFLLERAPGADAPDAEGLLQGFTVPEMARIVGGLLRTTGLSRRLPPLVLVLGHGSSSLNNPHESAYDCGATGGGRGGPSARAFALMANDPRVRGLLRDDGVDVPDGTWFVGGEHDTASDEVRYFDLAAVPPQVRAPLARAEAAVVGACRLNAQERARRFESAGLAIAPGPALAHVRARAMDLGQPRPELGHATNAIAVVGRRSRTRGLFLDRRAFLVSYDPAEDPEGVALAQVLGAVAPVGAGINLEYYFSTVDSAVYGAGTKLPHNIVGLIGVMDGSTSDLRTGLPWQMVEIHEPVRLLLVVEAEPALLERIAANDPAVGRLVGNRWVELVAWSPSTGRMSVFTRRGFEEYSPSATQLPSRRLSVDHFRGERGHLPPARIEGALARGVA